MRLFYRSSSEVFFSQQLNDPDMAIQCKLFHSFKPLFAGKPTFVVVNKIDVARFEDVSPENRILVEEIVSKEDVKFVQMSCHSEEGVMDLKNQACETLLAHRVEHKVNSSKVNNVLNRIF